MRANIATNQADAPSAVGERRRILYFMHVDWRWIKQRPQFIAESLAGKHDVHVLHRWQINSIGQIEDCETSLPLSPLLPIPWLNSQPLRCVTGLLQRRWVQILAKRLSPDLLWVTHPSLFQAIPASLSGLPIVYDCMDDALAFAAKRDRLVMLADLERALLARAAIVLCSSDRLRAVLKDRYGAEIGSKIAVIRNAISPLLMRATCMPAPLHENPDQYRRKRIGYIGTIAEWLDFEILLSALKNHSNLEIHLVGPVALKTVPGHDRLCFHGAVPHAQLVSFAEQFDAYVMPFRINPLIEAVDPVKLYEYLAFGKEILTIRYSEVERFREFVHFYESRDQFLDLVSRFVEGKLDRKNWPQVSRPFLSQNTWLHRSEQICDLLVALPARCSM